MITETTREGWGGGGFITALVAGLAPAGPSLEAVLAGARGRIALGRFAEVEARLSPLEDEAARAPLDVGSEYLRTRVYALHCGGSGADAALALLGRSGRWHDSVDWEAELAALTAWILLDRAQPRRAVAILGTLPYESDLSTQVRFDTLLVLAVAESRLGRIGRCEALEAQISRFAGTLDHGGRDTGWARHVVDAIARVEAARDLPGVAGRLERARATAEADNDVVLTAALGMALGRLALIRGHCLDAIDLLEDAVDGLFAGDPRDALGLTLTYLTRAHALMGNVVTSAEMLARAEAVANNRRGNLRLALEVERARAWSEAADGRTTAASRRLLAVADRAAEEELVCEAEAVHEALRLGAAAEPCAQRLARLATAADSELLAAMAAHAAAVAAADATGLQEAAERFAALGADLLAAEAAASAARAFASEGRHSSTRRAAALAAKHAALCQGARTPMLTLPTRDDGLTPREREAATLAARGWRNADIAYELVLSVRSVETYVLRACRKLGTDSRAGLAHLLAPEATQGATPSPRR